MPPRHQGQCVGCGESKPLTRHHVLPVRFYGKGKHNEHIVLLCAPCHHEIETRIPRKQKLLVWQYFAIVAKFIKEKSDAR